MKVAVLGLGSAGGRHAGHLLALGHEVIGYDPEPAAAPGLEGRAPSIDAAIERADAVIVATPSSMHAEHSLAALREGKHLLCEKPLATGASDARAIRDVALNGGLVCGVAMNLRFHPGVVELKRLVDDGDLGDAQLAQAYMGYALPMWRPQTDYRRSYSAQAELGGGIVWDALHELDYLLWILGPIDTVTAEVGEVSELEIDVEDVAMAILRFESGVLASVALDYVQAAYRRGCVLSGSKAVAHWDWIRGTVQVSSTDGEQRTIDVSCELDDTYRQVVADFTQAIGEGRSPRTSADQGVAAVIAGEAVHESALRGTRIAVP